MTLDMTLHGLSTFDERVIQILVVFSTASGTRNQKFKSVLFWWHFKVVLIIAGFCVKEKKLCLGEKKKFNLRYLDLDITRSS